MSKREVECCDTCDCPLANGEHFKIRLHGAGPDVSETIMCKGCALLFLELLAKECPDVPIERKILQ